MSIEREIKLALPTSQHDELAHYFEQFTGRPGRKITLVNVYFDTPGLALAKAKSAIRLRRTPDAWLQTYKTAGESSGGMHTRHEWEMPVAGEALEIDALLEACDNDEARAALKDAAPEIGPLFHTDFARVIWDVEHEGAHIEVALDLGEVRADVNGETRTMPISEVEMELKSGDESALATLSAELRGRFIDLQPEDVSKAQRGYRLREENQDNPA